MLLSLIYTLICPELLSKNTIRYHVRKPDIAFALRMLLRTLPTLSLNMPRNHIKKFLLKCWKKLLLPLGVGMFLSIDHENHLIVCLFYFFLGSQNIKTKYFIQYFHCLATSLHIYFKTCQIFLR